MQTKTRREYRGWVIDYDPSRGDSAWEGEGPIDGLIGEPVGFEAAPTLSDLQDAIDAFWIYWNGRRPNG